MQAYEKYLNREVPEPQQEVLDFLAKRETMDPAKAMLPENGNMDEILAPGYLEHEYGYCLLPNGGGYIAMCNKMPGVTVEMYNWYADWRTQGTEEDTDKRYQLWYPPMHRKARGRWECEEFGCGLEELYFLEFVTPKMLGITVQPTKEQLLALHGGSVLSKLLSETEPVYPRPGTVGHFIRALPDGQGIEIRSRFWKGYHPTPAGFVSVMTPHTPRETEESLWRLADHNAREMASLADILPQLYREFA